MQKDFISYQSSGYFSTLINDYLDQKTELKALYNRFPTIENFDLQIQEKSKNYNTKTAATGKRATLVTILKNQYASIKTSEATAQNIESLAKPDSFTITTGHQLNLFTGPLYFLYKITSTIALCRKLKENFPDKNFVPVYWMATEDHDFQEINYFKFKKKKLAWNRESKGPVGRLSTNGLKEFLEIFKQELGTTKNAGELANLFKEAYLENNTLAEANRYLVNKLFGDFGLVILDADNAELKQILAPYIEDELLNQTSYKKVSDTNKKLKQYDIQVNPREINLFYIEDQLRERIILEKGIYRINNTNKQFSETEILELLKKHPEKFSPNVIMRSLYQEVILPNLCYIGGGGEISYWLELKSYFEEVNISFPILLVRNSVLLVTEKQVKRAAQLDLTWGDLFLKQNELTNKKIKELSSFPIDFTEQKIYLSQQFEKLHVIANQTDKSFLGAVQAQETKQIKGLENLEKRLLKAQKRKHRDTVDRITMLQNELFPGSTLQEREDNFSEYFIENGKDFIANLLVTLDPLKFNFEIITIS